MCSVRTEGIMSKSKACMDWRAAPIALSMCALIYASPAIGQTVPPSDAPAKSDTSAKKDDNKRPTVAKKKPTSPNVTVNLLNLMVKRKLLSEDEAQALIKEAEDETYVSRQATKDATTKAD